MATKKNMRISYPSSEKIYVPGEINKIKVGMRKIKLLDTVTLDEHGERIFKKNNPVIVYDTSGPYSDPKISIDIAKASLSNDGAATMLTSALSTAMVSRG